MKLTNVLLRSYRSYNYDFKRKHGSEGPEFPTCKDPWDTETDFDSWRPMVNSSIGDPIACIVGPNGSGKSYLVYGTLKVMANEDFVSDDVCRYSRECSVGQNGMPLLGLVWGDLTSKFIEALNTFPALSKSPIENAQDVSLAIFRDGNGPVRLLTLSNDNKPLHDFSVSRDEYKSLTPHLPRPVKVTTGTFLPGKVPMNLLFRAAFENLSDQAINSFLEKCNPRPFPNAQEAKKVALDENTRLVFRLLRHCANIDHESLYRISKTSEPLLKDFSEQITGKAEVLLNLSLRWAQDVDARLNIDLRTDEVLLSITDRTGSYYAFDERSKGLKYFLAYLIQILLEFKADSRPLVILSEEPDFALSAVGQRDLLRFFREIVTWQRDEGRSQFIYTTHSAELIDPNFPERVAVVRKGMSDEGTMVMDTAHRRLFEPVRTALGARVSTFPFLDGPNLVVEGLSERTFIIRMSQHFAKRNLPFVDLAYLSIVDAEGSDHVPRIVLTAKSVPGDRAYLTVLLDNDEHGKNAAKLAKQHDRYLDQNQQVVLMDQILGPGLGKDSEIEDLIPPQLYYEAFLDVMRPVLLADQYAKLPDKEAIRVKAATQPIVDVVTTELKAILTGVKDVDYDKEAVIDRAFDIFEANSDGPAAVEFRENLNKMTSLLLEKIDENLRNKKQDEVSRAMHFVTKDFGASYPNNATNADALKVLEKVRGLGNRVSPPGVFDAVIDKLVADFGLKAEMKYEEVKDYPRFLNVFKQLPQKLTVDRTKKMM